MNINAILPSPLRNTFSRRLPDFDAVGISHLGEVNRDVAVMRDRETAFGPSGQPRVWLGLVRVISRSATG